MAEWSTSVVCMHTYSRALCIVAARIVMNSLARLETLRDVRVRVRTSFTPLLLMKSTQMSTTNCFDCYNVVSTSSFLSFFFLPPSFLLSSSLLSFLLFLVIGVLFFVGNRVESLPRSADFPLYYHLHTQRVCKRVKYQRAQ